jgi:hypothetical protein
MQVLIKQQKLLLTHRDDQATISLFYLIYQIQGKVVLARREPILRLVVKLQKIELLSILPAARNGNRQIKTF